jgi:hypothetical protein
LRDSCRAVEGPIALAEYRSLLPPVDPDGNDIDGQRFILASGADGAISNATAWFN